METNKVFSSKEIVLLALASLVMVMFLMVVFYLPSQKNLRKAQREYIAKEQEMMRLKQQKSGLEREQIEERDKRDERGAGVDTQEFFAAFSPIAQSLEVHLGKFAPKGEEEGRSVADLQAEGQYSALVRLLDKVESNTWADVYTFRIITLTNSEFEARIDMKLENIVERDLQESMAQQSKGTLDHKEISSSPMASKSIRLRQLDLTSKYEINSVQMHPLCFRYQNHCFSAGDPLDENWVVESIDLHRITLRNPKTREGAVIDIP